MQEAAPLVEPGRHGTFSETLAQCWPEHTFLTDAVKSRSNALVAGPFLDLFSHVLILVVEAFFSSKTSTRPSGILYGRRESIPLEEIVVVS